jgi:two-component system response regulator YesN
MGKCCTVSPNYLSKVFKAEMGVNFVDWQNQLRVEKAKFFLCEANSRIYEVAERVGK